MKMGLEMAVKKTNDYLIEEIRVKMWMKG